MEEAAVAAGAPTGGSTARSDDVAPLLLAAARRGDHDAYAQILRHYDRRMRLIASRLLHDRQLMDDALQETAIKAIAALPKLRNPEALGTWLCRITYTTCVDQLRRWQPVELRDPRELPDVEGPRSDPAEIVAEAAALAELLRALPPEQRIAVVLVDQEGLGYRRASEILGIPMGTVASRLNAARATLREVITSAKYREDT